MLRRISIILDILLIIVAITVMAIESCQESPDESTSLLAMFCTAAGLLMLLYTTHQ